LQLKLFCCVLQRTRPTLANGKIYITSEDPVTPVIKVGTEFVVLEENNGNTIV
jgi:hypothetical protein